MNMRILLSSVPQHGHLLPMLPLARAFDARDDEVAVLTAAGMAPALEPDGFALLPAGPLPDVLFAEVARRTGGADPSAAPTPEAVAEFFAGTRLDLTADEALRAVEGFRPDLIVSDLCDFVGPFTAAAAGVPVAALAFGPALPEPFAAAMTAVAAPRYAARGLVPGSPSWYLDTCPPSMQQAGWQRPDGRLPLRPEAFRAPGQPGAVTGKSTRPKVLVSFGTVFADPAVVGPILRELSTMDVDIVATATEPARFGVDGDRVAFVGFTPMSELLDGVDLVITHGGAGTTFGTLSRGIPLVVVPQGADNFIQAERLAASGAGIALPPDATPRAVAEAAGTVLGDIRIHEAAAAVGKEIDSMPSPGEVAATLAAALR